MKYVVFILMFYGCQGFQQPSHRFSIFYGTPAERIVKAIEKNDIQTIREEIKKNPSIVDFKDSKYDMSLLDVSIFNYKQRAFEELLKLGANPNIESGGCSSPLKSAIIYPPNKCDLFFINKLIKYNANVRLEFFNRDGCSKLFDREAILDVILYQSHENIECGIKMLKSLTANLGTINLNEHNNSEDYYQNIVFFSLKQSNLEALKFFIIDLKSKVPEKIFIDGTVIEGFDKGYLPLKQILLSDDYPKTLVVNEKVRKELINYLSNKPE